MKKYLIIGFILTVLLSLSFTKKHFANSANTSRTKDTTADQEFQQAWEEFSNVILKQDQATLKSLSSECILCTICIDNTLVEDSIFKKFQEENPDQWVDKFYDELCYVSIDKFITEDLNIIFDEKVKSRLLDKTKINFVDNNHHSKPFHKKCFIGKVKTAKCEFKEVLLTHIDPTPQLEGSQWSFEFVKTNGKHKFCGFSTIP